jgi:hypothetical protein
MIYADGCHGVTINRTYTGNDCDAGLQAALDV